MSSESQRKRLREDDRHNRHKRNSSDMDSHQKDTELNKLRHYLSRSEKKIREYSNENLELKAKNQDLESVIRKKKKNFIHTIDEMKADFEKKSRGINDYIQTTTATKQTLEKEKTDALAKLEELSKQLAEQQSLNQRQMSKLTNISKTISEQTSTIKRLNTEKKDLTANNSEKDTQIDSLKKDLESAEKETNQLIVISSKLKTYYDNNEDFRLENERLRQQMAELNTQNCGPECQQLRTDIQKLNNEIHSLKKQRKYFEDHNNIHKQNVLAVSHTAIKQQQLYANTVRQVAISDMSITDKVCEEVTERVTDILKDVPNVIKRQITEQLATTVTTVGEGLQQIHENQRKMQEKRSDGKVYCGSCDLTFANCGALKQHMTLKHNMNTTDLNKNKVELILID